MCHSKAHVPWATKLYSKPRISSSFYGNSRLTFFPAVKNHLFRPGTSSHQYFFAYDMTLLSVLMPLLRRFLSISRHFEMLESYRNFFKKNFSLSWPVVPSTPSHPLTLEDQSESETGLPRSLFWTMYHSWALDKTLKHQEGELSWIHTSDLEFPKWPSPKGQAIPSSLPLQEIIPCSCPFAPNMCVYALW